jgi:hypothetical protein
MESSMSNAPLSPDQAAAEAAQNGGDPDAAYWGTADRINAIAYADHMDQVRGELHVKLMASRQGPVAGSAQLPVVLASSGGSSERSL